MPEYVVDSKRIITLEVVPKPPTSPTVTPTYAPSPPHKPSPTHVPTSPIVTPSPSPTVMPSPVPKKPLVQKIKEFVSSHKLELLAGLGFLALGAVIFRRHGGSELVMVKKEEKEKKSE